MKELSEANKIVKYDSMTEVGKCNVGGLIPLIPTGIRVKYVDENGKNKKMKMSVMGRKDVISIIKSKMGA